MAEGDIRLTVIIQQHSQRMNAIVENILQLSRRQRSQPEEFELSAWLHEFIAIFCSTQGIENHHVSIDINPTDTIVRIDPSHLFMYKTF